jgi:hypothetical protein
VDDWKYWEIFWVAYYKNIGCNLLNYTIGGDGITFGNSGSLKNCDKPWNTGISCSKTTREKISKSLTGIPTGRTRKIIQYDMLGNLINIYPSMTEAINNTNFLMSKISDCCNNKRKHHKNIFGNVY